jgi:hypothetical protein
MSKTQTLCENFLQSVSELGASVWVRDGVVEVYKRGVSEDTFDDTLWKVQKVVYTLGRGHVWGTDGVGYICNKSKGLVSVMISPTNSRTVNTLAKLVGAE